MAKTLVLVRHAKAVAPGAVPDHDRPLATRGRADAAAAGRWLRSIGVLPQVALVSAARRTRETYQLLGAELGARPDATVTDDAYNAGAEDLLELVRALPPEAPSAIVIAHNPGIGTLANALDDGASTVEGTDRMHTGYPTTSVAVFAVDGDWTSVDPGAARLTAFTVARA